jgi:quercetin dioxygenase-like cupin family protein
MPYSRSTAVYPEESMKTLLSHVAWGAVAFTVGSSATYVALREPGPAHAAQPAAVQAAQQRVLFETTMADVLGRVVAIREFERAPGTGGEPHRHPGSHTFGYVLQGTYEVQVDDGPLQRLGPGQTFYEQPGALHAVSRNGSSTDIVRYLVFTVSDPTLPATVPQ